MDRSETLSIEACFNKLLEEDPELHEGLLEQRTLAYLPRYFGSAYQDIQKAYIKDGVLCILTYSPSLRQILLLERNTIIRHLNDTIQAELLHELRLLRS